MFLQVQKVVIDTIHVSLPLSPREPLAWDWKGWSAVLVVLTAFYGALAFILTPMLDKMHLRSHRREQKEHDELVVIALANRAADVRSAIEKMFADRIAWVNENVEKVPDHEERLEMIFESIQRQGASLTNEFTKTIQAQTDTLKSIAEAQRDSMRQMAKQHESSMGKLETAVSKIHDEAQANAKAISNLHGIIEGARNANGDLFKRRQGDE